MAKSSIHYSNDNRGVEDMKYNFLQELKWRGLIKDITPFTESNFESVDTIAGYIGFDPTAPSLHVGNLCAIMLLKHLQLSGHKPIVLLGGFTGRIGDPAGKVNERKILSEEIILHNIDYLRNQFSKFLDFSCGKNSAEIVDNIRWLSNLSLADFLKDVGRYFSVNYMIAKDSVKSRLENGLSFNEFVYQLFQAYDFYWLYNNKNCKLQMGGSDQWGNITGGVELLRRKDNKEGFAFTTPLLLKPDGGKFGKSEEGNIWLDANLTSPYKFYQFWLNVEDVQIGSLLRIFTFLSKEEIEQLEHENASNPNKLKRVLAKYLTTVVHSADISNQVEKASNLLFGNPSLADYEAIDETILHDLFHGLETYVFMKEEYNSSNVDYVVHKVFAVTKSESRRLINGNGITINTLKVSDYKQLTSEYFLVKGKYLIIKKGKTYGVAIFI